MTLAKKIDIARICKAMEGMSGAEIKSVCTEAGYFAIREEKFVISEKDFLQAVDKVKNDEEFKESRSALAMFG